MILGRSIGLIVDLSNLINTGSSKHLKETIIINDELINNNQIVSIPDKFNVDITVYKTQDSFVFTGTSEGTIILRCSRCLEEFNYNTKNKINKEILIKNIKDYLNFNLEKIFVENIILELPLKPLCSENCKGLCPICGQNLNHGECNCEIDTTDSRLAKLKNFFDNDEEV